MYGAAADADVLLYPPLSEAGTGGWLFGRYPVGGTGPVSAPAQVRLLAAEGPAREPVVDPASGNASAPTDADFDAAAVYEIDVPAELLDGDDETLLRIDWTGDVGRAYIGDTLVADQFWCGSVWEIGLRRHWEHCAARPGSPRWRSR
ncbi:hypothetical protein [Dactylosporangium sp. NPDC050588]|uniref:hypothetical protein n=1 Tax=Dactylosporangium sp. NPDC050588 TaxID=3157211 RepID=UPI0033DE60E0